MFDIRDLFQWDRFITPFIIRYAYGLAIALIVLAGLSGMFGALNEARVSPIGGLITLLITLIAMCAGIVFVRIAAEFVLVTFRISEHLGALRNRAGG